jgi:prepilin-type N-terminal cleavage/methylation domain-containing protein
MRLYPSARSGFTLFELMLAMSLLALVLVSARMLFSSIADTKALVIRDAAHADSLRNGERMARLLIRSAEAAPDTGNRFVGNALDARFTTSCRTGGGWLERCRVRLSLDRRPDTTALLVEVPPGHVLELLRRPGASFIRYIAREAQGETWFDSWGENILVPDAIAIVSGSDTLVFLTDGRGG